MTKLVQNDITSLTNEQSALAALNSNYATLEAFSDTVLSRDGTTPNEMNSDLDMNSNQILNLPAPTSAAEPLRLQDLSDFIGGGLTISTFPVNASFVTTTAESGITGERVLTAGTGIALTDGGAGTTMTVAVSPRTGTGNAVFSTSPTLVTPILGTPTSGTLTNCTGLPVSTGVSGLGAGVATFLATPSSANLITAVTNETGTGALVFATSPTLVTPVLGTPSSGTLTSCTGLPISTGVSGLGANVATFLATPSSANLISALTDETGSGAAVFATSPTLVTPVLGTPTSGTLSNCTGYTESFVIACSDETTALTTGTAKVKFRMPYAFTVTAVRASLSTAQTSGSIFTVDINESGTTIISTKLTIDNAEATSTTAATPAVISDSALADDAEMSVDIDQVGDGTAKGLKVYIIGRR